MARGDIVVRLIGDPSSLKKGLRESETGLLQFEGATKKTHMALSSLVTGMIGAGGVVFGLEKMISAAKAAQESQDHLAVTMKDAGLSYDANKRSIEAVIQKQSELSGFQKTDVRDTYGALIRQTKDVSQANTDLAIAVDIARGRHIDLATAQQIVIKANMGMVGQLKRMGIDISPVKDAMNALTDSHLKFTTAQKDAAKALDLAATKQKAIALLQQTYAGQAEAYGKSSAGAADRFKVSLTNLEVTLGTALLPTLTAGLKHVTAWVTKLNDSGDAAKYAKEGASVLKGVIHDATPIVKTGAAAFESLADALGGDKQAVEALGGALVAWKLAGTFSAIGTSAGEAGAAGSVGLLTKRLNQLKLVGPITIAIELAIHRKGIQDSLHQKFGEAGKIAGMTLFMYDTLWKEITGQAHGGGGGFPGAQLPNGTSGRQANIVATAQAVEKDPSMNRYVYGGGNTSGPTDSSVRHDSYHFKGFDCSSFVQYVMAQNGIQVPRTSEAQAAGGHPVPKGQLAPGDIVFTDGWPHPGHVGIYVGDGKVIHDPHTGASITTSTLAEFGWNGHAVRYWKESKNTSGMSSPANDANRGSAVGSTDTTSIADILAGGKHKKGKVLTGSRLLSMDLQKALATDAGTKSTADDLRDLKKAETELLAMPQTLPVIKELASVRKAINAIETADEKKAAAERAAAVKEKLKEQAAAYKAMTAEVKRELEAQTAAWNKHIKDLQAVAATTKQKLLNEWTSAGASILAGFDKSTTEGLTKLQKDYAAVTAAFDKETKKGLAALASPAQTKEEKDLADFIAGRTSTAHDQKAAQLQADLQTAQEELAKLGTGGSIVDLTTGITTHRPADDAAIKAAQDKVKAAQDAIDQFALDDQQTVLQAKADASRKAADKAAADAQQAYQDQRDALKAHMDDQEQILENGYTDQRAIERDNLDKWLNYMQTQLDAGKASWQQFYEQLAAMASAYGFDPSGAYGMSGAAAAASNAAAAAATAAAAAPYLGINQAVQGGMDPAIALAMAKARGHIPGFADGGPVTRTGLALVHAGEHVIPKDGALVATGGGGDTVIHSHVYLDGREIFTSIQREANRNKFRNGKNGLG